MSLHLFYHGGSGGFFALWHILLGSSYECSFLLDKKSNAWAANHYNTISGTAWPTKCPADITDFNESILKELDDNGWTDVMKLTCGILNNSYLTTEEIYNKHWNISDQSTWKNTEVWPFNSLTEVIDDYKNKIFFTCNPTDADVKNSKADLKILLYTDLETQVALASAKNAWYWHTGAQVVVPPASALLNRDTVYSDILTKSKLVDHSIKLQDVVKSKGQNLLSRLGSKINDKNIEHNDMWLNLHTPEQKRLLVS